MEMLLQEEYGPPLDYSFRWTNRIETPIIVCDFLIYLIQEHIQSLFSSF